MLQIVLHISDTCFLHAEQCLLKILCSLKHPTVGEVTVFFGGRVYFQHYTHKKQKRFYWRFVNYAIQVDIHMTWVCTLVRIGHIWLKVTATPVTVRNLTGKVQGHEHQLGGTQLNCNRRVIAYFVSNPLPHISNKFWNGSLECTVTTFSTFPGSLFTIILSLCMTVNDTCRMDEPTSVLLFNILRYRIIHKILWCIHRGSQLPLNP